MIHIHNGILFSRKKRPRLMPFAAAWMSQRLYTKSDISQKEKDTLI